MNPLLGRTIFHIQIKSDFWKSILEVTHIPVTSTCSPIRFRKFTQTFLFEKIRLIAPPRNRNIQSSIRTFHISSVPHHVWNAAITSENFYPFEKVKNIFSPKTVIPFPFTIETAETIKFQGGGRILPCKFNLSFDDFLVRHVIEGKNIIIVDDVLTSGATLRRGVELLLPLRPANTVVSCVAKSVKNDKRLKN